VRKITCRLRERQREPQLNLLAIELKQILSVNIEQQDSIYLQNIYND